MVIDPICCLTVDESTECRTYFNGGMVYFCSDHCREKFLSASVTEKHKRTHQEIGAHTCARHPELWQEDPCDCPKCLMAVEPATKSEETEGRWKSKSPEMTALSRLFAALVLPLVRSWRSITMM